MINIKLLVFICLAVSIPFTASAKWWNPVDWFQSEKIEIEKSIKVIPVDKTSTTTSSIPELIDEKEPLPVVEKVVEKIVTKTVPVDNPELLAKIVRLEAENIILKQQIEQLRNSLEKLPGELNVKVDYQPKMSAGCQALKDSYASLSDEEKEALDPAVDDLEDFKDGIVKLNSLGEKKISEYQGKINSIKSTFLAKRKEIEQKFVTLCPGKELI